MARIGLLSDSHGRAKTTLRAVSVLAGAGVDRLIHLGDIGNIEVVDALLLPHPDPKRAARDELLPAHLVFGNVDWEAEELGLYARRVGVQVDHPMGRLEFDGASLYFTHGDNPHLMEQALARGATYLCHGHSHEVRDERIGPTRVVNPGALFRAVAYTVAVLDTATDRLEFFPVSR